MATETTRGVELTIGSDKNRFGMHMGYIAVKSNAGVQKFYTGKSRETRNASLADAQGLAPEVKASHLASEAPSPQMTLEQVLANIPF